MRQLIFKTIDNGGKTYCAMKGDNIHLAHRFAHERNGHGHDPGYVYLVYLPKGNHRGQYHIGKSEYPRVGCDDFNLDLIDVQLLDYLQKRLQCYHPAQGTDLPYDCAKFVHAIRVACGEGAEKQPHHFFRSNQTIGREVFNMTKNDINIFQNAQGSILGREIKHLSAETYASYLKNLGMPDEVIRRRVLLPDEMTLNSDSFKEYLIPEVYEKYFSINRLSENGATVPRINSKTFSISRDRGQKWYTVNGFQGTELPTLFERCVKAYKNAVPLHVTVSKNIDIEDVIFQFKSHWRYPDYTERYNVSPDEWTAIFTAIRSESIDRSLR